MLGPHGLPIFPPQEGPPHDGPHPQDGPQPQEGPHPHDGPQP